MTKLVLRRPLAAALGLVLCVVCGCGVGEYTKRMQTGLNTIKQGSAFKDLSAPKDVPGVGVSLRLPSALGQALSKGATVENAPVDDARLKPLGLDWPGLKETYEGLIPGRVNDKFPYYFSVFVPDQGSTTLERVRTLVRNTIGEKLPDTGDWQDEAITTPEGGSVTWKKLHATGEQDFLYFEPNKASARKMPGILDVYLREQGGKIVFVVWRVPQSIEQNANLAEMSKLVCGSLVIKE